MQNLAAGALPEPQIGPGTAITDNTRLRITSCVVARSLLQAVRSTNSKSST